MYLSLALTLDFNGLGSNVPQRKVVGFFVFVLN